MQRTLINTLFVAALTLFVVGCTSQSGNSEKPVKIGISLGPTDGRWLKDKDFLVENLKAKGAEVVLREAKEDATLQEQQVDELIEEGVHAMIVVAVNTETLGKKINEARQAGIKVVAYDRLISNCKLDFYVSFDNVKVGEIQADYLTRIVPKGNFMVLGGSPDDTNSKFLRLGQMNILQPLVTKGDIKIVHEASVENWDANVAYNIVKDYLSGNNPKLDAVVSSSDDLSAGVVKALEETGLAGKVMVSGQDAQESACRSIYEGAQIMTVYKIIESLALTGSNVALTLAKNESTPQTHLTMNNGEMMVPSILLPSMIAVNKENLRQTVIADGYLDEAKVYGNM